MSFKFKVGDKVRILVCPMPSMVGQEGTVTKLGGTTSPDKGAIVTNEEFFCGDPSYGEHGVWFHDHWLELVE